MNTKVQTLRIPRQEKGLLPSSQGKTQEHTGEHWGLTSDGPALFKQNYKLNPCFPQNKMLLAFVLTNDPEKPTKISHQGF